MKVTCIVNSNKSAHCILVSSSHMLGTTAKFMPIIILARTRTSDDDRCSRVELIVIIVVNKAITFEVSTTELKILYREPRPLYHHVC